jgi:hypothetical protein
MTRRVLGLMGLVVLSACTQHPLASADAAWGVESEAQNSLATMADHPAVGEDGDDPRDAAVDGSGLFGSGH